MTLHKALAVGTREGRARSAYAFSSAANERQGSRETQQREMGAGGRGAANSSGGFPSPRPPAPDSPLLLQCPMYTCVIYSP